VGALGGNDALPRLYEEERSANDGKTLVYHGPGDEEKLPSANHQLTAAALHKGPNVSSSMTLMITLIAVLVVTGVLAVAYLRYAHG
jgi:hypothetical protein